MMTVCSPIKCQKLLTLRKEFHWIAAKNNFLMLMFCMVEGYIAGDNPVFFLFPYMLRLLWEWHQHTVFSLYSFKTTMECSVRIPDCQLLRVQSCKTCWQSLQSITISRTTLSWIVLEEGLCLQYYTLILLCLIIDLLDFLIRISLPLLAYLLYCLDKFCSQNSSSNVVSAVLCLKRESRPWEWEMVVFLVFLWKKTQHHSVVGQMQKVIELACQIRERHSKPLKQALQFLAIVHPKEILLILQAPDERLLKYTYQETDVRDIRDLRTCNDPEICGVITAELNVAVSHISESHEFPIKLVDHRQSWTKTNHRCNYEQNQSTLRTLKK